MISKKYHIYDLMVDSINPVATINEIGTITGPKAENMERFLRRRGWPEVRPDIILHWGYCWAEEAKENINGRSTEGKLLNASPFNMTYREMDFEFLDMMVESDKELATFMTPEEIKEMRDYLANKKKVDE